MVQGAGGDRDGGPQAAHPLPHPPHRHLGAHGPRHQLDPGATRSLLSMLGCFTFTGPPPLQPPPPASPPSSPATASSSPPPALPAPAPPSPHHPPQALLLLVLPRRVFARANYWLVAAIYGYLVAIPEWSVPWARTSTKSSRTATGWSILLATSKFGYVQINIRYPCRKKIFGSPDFSKCRNSSFTNVLTLM